MFGWLRRNPTKRLERAYVQKLEQARDIQRKGDIVRYSELMAEAEELRKQLDALSCRDCDA